MNYISIIITKRLDIVLQRLSLIIMSFNRFNVVFVIYLEQIRIIVYVGWRMVAEVIDAVQQRT